MPLRRRCALPLLPLILRAPLPRRLLMPALEFSPAIAAMLLIPDRRLLTPYHYFEFLPLLMLLQARALMPRLPPAIFSAHSPADDYDG
jgi:hypothetical protein